MQDGGRAHRQVLLICELCSCTMASSACSTSAATSTDCSSASSSTPLTELAERPCRAWLAPLGDPKMILTCHNQSSRTQTCAVLLRVRAHDMHTYQRAEVLCVKGSLYGVRDAVRCSNARARVGVAVWYGCRGIARLHAYCMGR